MSFRRATPDDEQIFLEWRHYGEENGRRHGFWHGRPTISEQHHHWFLRHLNDARLLVWEEDAGIARIDSNGEVSFETDPSLRPAILTDLKPLARLYGDRLKATLDHGDPKADALLDAGFVEHPVRFFVYRP